MSTGGAKEGGLRFEKTLLVFGDSSGAITLVRAYSPYGETTQSLGDFATPSAFTGELTDASGLIYLRARSYDPATGRFVSRDPFSGMLMNPSSLVAYTYAYNNPTMYNDPSGQFAWVIAGALVGGIASYGIQVAANYRNGITGTSAWTDVNASSIVTGALLGAGAVLLAPAAVSLVGDALTGTALLTGSTKVFAEGMALYAMANIIEANIVYGSPLLRPLPVLEYSSNASEVTAADYASQTAGKPRVLTYTDDREIINRNRAQSLYGNSPIQGAERHEYPYASSLQGGKGATVTYVSPIANSSHGAQLARFARDNELVSGNSRYIVGSGYSPQITWLGSLSPNFYMVLSTLFKGATCDER